VTAPEGPADPADPTDPTAPADGADAGAGPGGSAQAASVARGGAANLLGALVYGASNFGLLIVLNRTLGQRNAGIVVVAIAVFQITSTVAALGCSTGLVRIISRDRATGHPERLPAVLTVAVVPVVVVGTLAAAGMWASAGWLSDVFARGAEAHRVADVLRAMALLLPAASLHTVLVQGTRGFDTMLPQVLIERVGRALALPLVVGVAASLDFGPRGVGVAWAATNVVALVFSARAIRWRVKRAVEGVTPVPASRAIAADFWSFTGPRAVGQASEVAVNWLDTVLVGALVSTTAAGIYASGTRYLLPGMFAAEALMQVTAPRISGLLARHRATEASELLQVVAGWQVTVMWPLYLITAIFPRPLLEVFGPQVVQARGALIALSVAMLVASPLGPAGSAVLMSGRSRQAMFNTLVFLGINLGGNLIFLPRHGITAAGLVWAATIIVAALLPNWQARRSLGVTTLGRPAFVAAGLAAGTIGVVALVARIVVGDDTVGLLVTSSVGGAAYLVGLRSLRGHLHLDALWDGIRRRSTPGSISTDPAPSTPGPTR
jgi:O-antigen/teichoic acid export membrane protein